jgi:hypothetical protein
MYAFNNSYLKLLYPHLRNLYGNNLKIIDAIFNRLYFGDRVLYLYLTFNCLIILAKSDLFSAKSLARTYTNDCCKLAIPTSFFKTRDHNSRS